MGLLENFANFTAGPPPMAPPRRRPRAMTAAGQRIDLSQPEMSFSRRSAWQEMSWTYRDTIPELQFVASFIRSSLGRLRGFPAERMPRGIAPQPLEDQVVARTSPDEATTKAPSQVSAAARSAALDASARLNLDQHGSSLLARLGENLEFAGEGYLLGEDGPDGEDWSIKSVSEVQIGNQTARLVEPGS